MKVAFLLSAVLYIWYNANMNIHDKNKFTTLLLEWYTKNARILPWREDCSAYRVWVSEIMLQQTRVEAVKPYFERFIKEIPSLTALANTDDDALHKLWEGLGYYNRVKNMKSCATQCVQEYQGELPGSAAELKKLPGIGDYTAGAIASIAYGECIPAVDGNVLRVFSRVLVCEDDILKEATKKKFQKIIVEYMPENESSQFNQALMELGALVCVPNAAPRCNICPVASQCLGYLNGDAHRLPNKTKKKARRIEDKTIVILVYHCEILLQKRFEEGLLAGLYEFLTLDGKHTRKDIEQQLHQYNIKRIVQLKKGKHVFSHVEWHMNGYLVEVSNKLDGIWCTYEILENKYAIPSAFKLYKDALALWMKEDS